MSIESVKASWNEASTGKKAAIIGAGVVATAAVGTTIAAGIKGKDILSNVAKGDTFDKLDVNGKEVSGKNNIFGKIKVGYTSFIQSIKAKFHKTETPETNKENEAPVAANKENEAPVATGKENEAPVATGKENETPVVTEEQAPEATLDDQINN